MKTKDWLLIGALGVGAYWLMKKGEARSDVNNGAFGPGVDGGDYWIPMPTGQTSRNNYTNQQLMAYNEAVKSFNTQPSIQAGIDVINAGYPISSIPRTSSTIKVLGQNDTIAKLANGNTVRVTATEAKRDSSGMTAFDRIIAKNKAISGVK